MTSRRSRPGRELLGAVAAGLVLWLAGCGDDGGGGSGGDDDASGGADGDGVALYQQSCASCHGEDLRGTDRGPSHLSQVYEPGHHPDESFRVAITQGSPAHHWQFGDMPPVPGLDDDEIDAIIAYIRSQQEAEGFEPYPPS
ncbi:MAG TPA: cytochrome c [Acidimicrobiales bacterium]|jgi:mono/diheme cytochrome c family protein|nr:cytochrome c [Acidimicrobiales bacterium]